MESKEAEKNNNNETEEETIALQKKRSRRVSFAETTAIHLFIRDEDRETPPDVANGSGNGSSESEGSSSRWLTRSESEEINELLRSSSDESDDDNDRDKVAVKRSFLRPMESPSSGGSTFGSATSNDEDNFFGPVSMDFIKPRRLSDSAASDENHDITMDSTAFSMHFRSLARSDSGGEFKTPTGIRLAFGERTPGQSSTPTNIGDMMVLTAGRKPISYSSLSTDKVNDSGHSDDMSLVSDNQHKYDYGELPPEFDVLLAEGVKDVNGISLISRVESSSPVSSLKKDTSAFRQNRHEPSNIEDNKGGDVCLVADVQKSSADATSTADVNIEKENDSVSAATLRETTCNSLYTLDNDPLSVTPTTDRIKAPLPNIDHILPDKFEDSRKDVMAASGNCESPSSRSKSLLEIEQPARTILSSSVSSLLAKRRDIFKVSVGSSKDKANLIPLAKSLCDEDSIKHVLSASCSLKGVSSLKRLEAFPFASTSKVERHASRLISPRSVIRPIAKYNLSECGSKEISMKHVDAPVACLESRFSTVAENDEEFKSKRKINSIGLRSMDDTEHASRNSDIAKDMKSQSLSAALSYKSTKNTSTMVSPSFTLLPNKGLEHPVSKDNAAKGTLESLGSDSSLLELTFNDKNDEPLEKLYHARVSNSSSALKRKIGMLLDKAEGNNDEIASSQRNSKLLKDQNLCAEGSEVSHKIGLDTAVRHWADVFTSFCRAYQQLLSPWIDKFDLALIETLNDILLHLKKINSYELFYHDIGCQKAFDFASLSQNKRMSEIMLLMHRTVYKKAKLQLIHQRRNKLWNQVEQLNSRVQESKILMSSCQHSCIHDQNDQAAYFQLESCLADTEVRNLGSDDVSSLRKELEVSDGKIKNLIKSLHSYFKRTKHPTCIEATESVEAFLKKTVSCRSLRSELQLCEVESLQSVHGQQKYFFDHIGFMSQSMVVNSKSTYGVSISNKMNNLKISKMFRYMDGSTAFSFVLNGETILTYAGLRTIAQETQRTNLLLHNLLDVVEELELALMELRHLTQSRFCQRSAGKLDLQICFSDFQSGARATLSVDVTCLNRGVYPSQVLPYEVQVQAAGTDDVSQLLLSNIRTSVRGLKCGHMRIISICRCVSKTIQATIYTR